LSKPNPKSLELQKDALKEAMEQLAGAKVGRAGNREGMSEDGRRSKPNAPKKAVGAGTMTGLSNVTAFVDLF
jgi:uncharacterized alpha-E superfamily protein